MNLQQSNLLSDDLSQKNFYDATKTAKKIYKIVFKLSISKDIKVPAIWDTLTFTIYKYTINPSIKQRITIKRTKQTTCSYNRSHSRPWTVRQISEAPAAIYQRANNFAGIDFYSVTNKIIFDSFDIFKVIFRAE